MKVEGYLFLFIFAFLIVTAGVYLAWSGDPSGTIWLALSAGFGLAIGSYCISVARRIPPRPEDRHDAEIEDGAGEVGFFSPHSWWPIAAAASFTVVALGAIFGYWLTAIGAVLTLISAAGFVFEYYVGRSA